MFIRYLVVSTLVLFLNACYRPPYNQFEPHNNIPAGVATGIVPGVMAGIAVSSGSVGSGMLIGGAAGGALGGALSVYHNSRPYLIKQLRRQQIQYIEYGDTMTLIIPTDRYYLFNSPKFHETCYAGLVNVLKLIQMYPHSTFFVAGFTDTVGSIKRQRLLSKARAETMLTFLWANGITAHRMSARGFGALHPIGDNHLIHGSAHNRRIEIQWTYASAGKPAMHPVMMTK